MQVKNPLNNTHLKATVRNILTGSGMDREVVSSLTIYNDKHRRGGTRRVKVCTFRNGEQRANVFQSIPRTLIERELAKIGWKPSKIAIWTDRRQHWRGDGASFAITVEPLES